MDPHEHSNIALRIADVTSVSLILGTIAGYLPAIAALLSIIYYVLLLSRAFNHMLINRRNRMRKPLTMAAVERLQTAATDVSDAISVEPQKPTVKEAALAAAKLASAVAVAADKLANEDAVAADKLTAAATLAAAKLAEDREHPAASKDQTPVPTPPATEPEPAKPAQPSV